MEQIHKTLETLDTLTAMSYLFAKIICGSTPVIYGYLMYFDSKVLSQNACDNVQTRHDESSAKDWIQLAPDCASLKPSWLVP